MTRKIIITASSEELLESLQGELRLLRPDWEILHFSNGTEALRSLDAQTAKALVADLDLPDMTGAQMLNTAAQRFPKILRFLVSSMDQKKDVGKSVGQPHHHVPRPWEAARLVAVLEEAFGRESWATAEGVPKLLWHVQILPSPPALYFEVIQELQSPRCSVEKVGRIVSCDPAMTAKLLQLANCALFGLRHRITSPAEAVWFLGLETTKALLLLAHTFSYFDHFKTTALSMEELWRHSLQTGILAREIAQIENSPPHMLDESFTAGLLHDLGKLILAANLPKDYRRVVECAAENQSPLWEAEWRTFQASHADLGSALLGIWGLPEAILEAVAWHHRPIQFSSRQFCPLTAVHVANVLDHQEALQRKGEQAPTNLDSDYLAELGLVERLASWQQAALGAKYPLHA